jgi:hypothetical protein
MTVQFSVFVQGNGQIWDGRGRVPQGSTLIFSAKVERETEKAVLLRSYNGRATGWCPKSAIKANGELADWIAVKLAKSGFSACEAIDCL